MTTPPRFLPNRPLPSYAFVPGQHPHPESDPAGHSYGHQRTVAAPFDATAWQSSQEYLRGLDLFNAGYYWECHVEFESLWVACGRTGLPASFFKGLIALAAAGVKHQEKREPGLKSHARRASAYFREVQAVQPLYAGLNLADLIAMAESIEATGWRAELFLQCE